MKTLFPGFQDLITLTPLIIDQYYDKLHQYCSKYKNIMVSFCTDLYSCDHHQYYNDDLESDINIIFDNSNLHRETISHQISTNVNNSFLKEFIDLSKELIIPRKLFNQVQANDYAEYKSLQHDISFEKIQQNLLFTKFIQKALRDDNNSDDVTYLDFGTGKGYFATYLSLDLKQKVIAIEASEKHARSLYTRTIQICKRYYKLLYEYIKQTTTHQGYHTEFHPDEIRTVENYKFCIKYISTEIHPDSINDTSLNLQQFCQSYQSENTSRNDHIKFSSIQGKQADILKENVNQQVVSNKKYVAVGLHACGDLSIIILKMLIQQPQIQYAFTIPCCYQHLSESCFPLYQKTSPILKLLDDDYFLISPKFVSFKLPMQLLNYACTGFDEPLEKAQDTVKQFFNRAVMEKCRYLCGQQYKICLKKKENIQTDQELVNWIHMVLQQNEESFQMTRNCIDQQIVQNGKTLSKQEIQEVINDLKPLYYKMKCHLLFRQIAGQVLESLILVDRLLYVKSQQQIDGQINWCMGGLTGRGFTVWCKRIQ